MDGEAKLNRQLGDQRKSGCVAGLHRGSERNTTPYQLADRRIWRREGEISDRK
jgi:hypothetical protein